VICGQWYASVCREALSQPKAFDISYYVLHNNRVIQLKNGRLVMPTGLHRFDKGKLLEGEIATFLSDDNGRTWRRSASVLKVIRTRMGCQYLSESKDNEETWSTSEPSGIFLPEAPATLARIPSTGDLLLIWDDHCDQPLEYRRKHPPIRTPFAAAISKDGGRTWRKNKFVEDQVGYGYCYTAVAFDGERVLLGYCAHKST
jgi:sialidase-1